MSSIDPATETSRKPVVITERDLVFYCPHCQGELVVDREGIGLEVNCPHCRQALIVPEPPTTTPAPAARIEPPAAESAPALPSFDFSGHTPEQIAQRQGELNHQFKENQSQDMEMRGHINRATIELHRLQLKLKKLQERNSAIAAELAALREASAKGS